MREAIKQVKVNVVNAIFAEELNGLFTERKWLFAVHGFKHGIVKVLYAKAHACYPVGGIGLHTFFS